MLNSKVLKTIRKKLFQSRKRALVFLSLIFGFLIVSCGSQEKSQSKSSNALFDRVIGIPVAFDNTITNSLFLATPATNVKVEVSGCSSNYSFGPVVISGGTVDLFREDENCLVKVAEFTFNSNVYAPIGTNAVPFTTWLAGDTAVFENQSLSTDTILVRVDSQVTQAGVLVTDTISYTLRVSNDTLPNEQIDTSVSISTPVVSSLSVPQFSVVESRAVGISASNMEVEFTLECSTALTGNSNPTYACESALLDSEIDYIFIEDTYSQGSITESEMDTAFSTHTPVSVNSLIVAPGGSDLDGNTLTNGGFYTSEVSPLTTEVSIFTNSSHVFMARYKSGANKIGYFYFYVQFDLSKTF